MCHGQVASSSWPRRWRDKARGAPDGEELGPGRAPVSPPRLVAGAALRSGLRPGWSAAGAHTQKNPHTQVDATKHTHTHAHAHTHAHTHTHTHTHTHRHQHAHAHAHAHAHTPAHTHHRHTRTHACTHTLKSERLLGPAHPPSPSTRRLFDDYLQQPRPSPRPALSTPTPSLAPVRAGGRVACSPAVTTGGWRRTEAGG